METTRHPLTASFHPYEPANAADDASAPAESSITQLLLSWRDGDAQASTHLLPLVYAELHRIAARAFAHEQPGHLLQPTALVHEAYERLVRQRTVHWQNRAHFYAIAARIMRRLLIDYARRQQRIRPWDEQASAAAEATPARAAADPVDIIALDEALSRLAAIAPRAARVVELRYFVGLTGEETALVLGVALITVNREWAAAKAWLKQALRADGAA